MSVEKSMAGSTKFAFIEPTFSFMMTLCATAPLVIVAYILTHTSSPSKQSPPIMEAVSPMLNVLFKVNPDVRMVT